MEKNPYSDALMLILRTQQQKIREIDKENWQFDTNERQWIIQRPVAPGVVDSTNFFNVVYKINGKIAGQWSVDTKDNKVTWVSK